MWKTMTRLLKRLMKKGMKSDYMAHSSNWCSVCCRSDRPLTTKQSWDGNRICWICDRQSWPLH